MTTPRIICIDPGKNIAVGYKDEIGEWHSLFLPGKKLFKEITDEQELWQIVIPGWAERVIEPLPGRCIVGVENFQYFKPTTSGEFMNRLIGSLVITVGRLPNVEKVILINNRQWEVQYFGTAKKIPMKKRKRTQRLSLGLNPTSNQHNEHELDAMCMAQWLTTQIKFGRI